MMKPSGRQCIANLKVKHFNENLLSNLVKELENSSSSLTLVSKSGKKETIPQIIIMHSPMLYDILKSSSPSDDVQIIVPDVSHCYVSALYELVVSGKINVNIPTDRSDSLLIERSILNEQFIEGVIAAGRLFDIKIRRDSVALVDSSDQYRSRPFKEPFDYLVKNDLNLIESQGDNFLELSKKPINTTKMNLHAKNYEPEVSSIDLIEIKDCVEFDTNACVVVDPSLCESKQALTGSEIGTNGIEVLNCSFHNREVPSVLSEHSIQVSDLALSEVENVLQSNRMMQLFDVEDKAINVGRSINTHMPEVRVKSEHSYNRDPSPLLDEIVFEETENMENQFTRVNKYGNNIKISQHTASENHIYDELHLSPYALLKSPTNLSDDISSVFSSNYQSDHSLESPQNSTCGPMSLGHDFKLGQRIHHRDIHGNLISNDIADYTLVECQVCQSYVTMTGLRSHTRRVHTLTITEYKSLYGSYLTPVENNYHQCGICGNLVLLDSDNIAKHLKIKGHDITHKKYNETYMVDTRSRRSRVFKGQEQVMVMQMSDVELETSFDHCQRLQKA